MVQACFLCMGFKVKKKSNIIKNFKRRQNALRNFDKLTAKQRKNLFAQLQRNNLLTPDHANAKTAKNMGLGVLSTILHLAPSNLSGFNVCPAASAGCRAACLNTAGRGRFESIQLARIQKTLYWVKAREQFLLQVFGEVQALERRAARLGLKAVVRLNGTSDIPYEFIAVNGYANIFEAFPNVQFYDYTKIFGRLQRLKERPISNYNVTFSAAENNWHHCKQALELGFNVAVVFNIIPETFDGFEVLNGDSHDLRFTDKTGTPGYIVGLKAKGKAKQDQSGFVKQIGAAVKAA